MFYSEILPKAPGSAARARRLLDQLAGDVAADVLDDARLLVSELVANAVVHVPDEGPVEVRVRVHDGTLRVEVLDPGSGFDPSPRQQAPLAESGWGLRFTEQLAERWGAESDGRTRVWFELTAT